MHRRRLPILLLLAVFAVAAIAPALAAEACADECAAGCASACGDCPTCGLLGLHGAALSTSAHRGGDALAVLDAPARALRPPRQLDHVPLVLPV